MRPSSLQLEWYFVDELSFSTQPDYNDERDVTIKAEDLKVKVHFFDVLDDPQAQGIELEIELPDSRESKFPYWFYVVLVGGFKLTKATEPRLAEGMLAINGPSMLYSAARELIALVTGRGPVGPIVLPSITFAPPPTKLAKSASKGKKTAAKKTSKK